LRHRFGWRARLIGTACLLPVLLVGLGAAFRAFAPTGNTSQAHFDAIIVLGNPADDDGNPTPTQLARVTEAVAEYQRGVASHLIMTGGAAHNRFVEAQVMARTAEAQGVPASAIVLDPAAFDTIQNTCNSASILEAHGWHSAEVVSSGSHLPRAGMIANQILDPLGIHWQLHSAPSLEPHPAAHQWAEATVEDLKTTRYLLWTRWVERCELK